MIMKLKLRDLDVSDEQLLSLNCHAVAPIRYNRLMCRDDGKIMIHALPGSIFSKI